MATRQEKAKDPLNLVRPLLMARKVVLVQPSREDALALAEDLVENGPLPKNASEDALHIAIATVYGIDYLLTWNCRHIANAQMRQAVASTCMFRGYETPIICTPEELMGE